MASIDPTALGAEAPHADVEIFSPLDRLLARAYALNWEHIFYVVMFVMAVLTRFVNLGDRVMSHDESLHVNYSYGLYHDGHFEHTPLMHGPLLFHMTALSFFLFGDSDFSGRIYPALLGVIMVLMPRLLFGRWLGKLGSAVASILLLISPMVLFHNRYIREDTPSIFFTLLMVYAFFAYVDGIKPKQTRYLLLLSAAMVLSLASKEVGFMYIAVFGLFLTIFWLMQIIQGIRKGETAPIVGWIIGGVVGVIAIAGVSYELGHLTANLLAANVVVSPTLLIAAYVFLFGAIAFLLLARSDGPMHNLLAAVGDNARSLFNLTAAGLIIGTVGALGMTCILSIIEGSASTDPAIVQSHEISWIFALVGALLFVVLGTALYHFTSGRWLAAALIVILLGAGLLLFVPMPFLLRLVIEIAIFVGFIALILWKRSPVRLPWGSILIVFAVGAVWCAGLTYFEESTRNVENPTVTAPATNPDGTPNTNRYDDIWIYGAWVIGAAAVGGILVLRFATPFFEEMRRYPTFDLLILLGTMILPWLAAFPVYKAGYPLGDNSVTGDALIASFKALMPFVAVSLVAGLCWDPGRWIAYAATFYGLFAFFYTTMFTNANGLGTGLIGSLGYWLVQQGVRRGSQPQYYYLLVELPVYEYLPVIGASVAGVVGMLGLWRFRAARIAESAVSNVYTAEGEGVLPVEGFAETPAVYETPEAVEFSAPTMAHSVEDMNTLPPLPDAEGQWQPLVASTPAQSEDEITLNQDMVSSENGESPVFDPAYAVEVTRPRVLHEIPEEENLSRLPFLPFVGFWGAMLIMAFTMAGEKMPWLTTHLTVPLIFITGWYIGLVLAKVERPAFTKQGWILIALTPIFLIALANVIGPFVFASNNLGTSNSFGPFGGLERDQLLQTFTW
ncbi:MAG TPA: flippase activity-associated protein Agl23, partial [Aggregatilineales bacterium]|nr:flippase activity-associated protein Agl23 [Aggregatilineales bacterium]